MNLFNTCRVGVVLCVLSTLQVHAQETLPIIDVHAHTYHNAGDVHWSGPSPDASHEQKNEDKFGRSQALWDKHNVKVAITSGELDRIFKWQNADPERVVPGAIIGPAPMTDEPFLNRIRDMAEKGEVQVLGEIALQYSGVPPDDPVYDVYFSLAEELDLPLAIHLGLGTVDVHEGAPLYSVSSGDPLLLEGPLKNHPDMRLYVMHAGWPYLDHMVGLMFTYPTVYVDIANINHNIPRQEFHAYLKRLVGAGFGKRIMFGSDSFAPDKRHSDNKEYFITFEERYARSIEYVNSAEFLTGEQKRDIFYNNAVRFFDLRDL